MKISVFQSILKLFTLFTIILFLLSNAEAAGVLDPAFGTNGRVITSVGNSASARASVIQPDGKIVVVGKVTLNSTGDDLVIVRYNSNGSLDTGFGNGGIIRFAVSPRNEVITSVALQPDGKIVVAGSTQPTNGSQNTDFLVVRFTADGGLDIGFGNNGVVTVNQSSFDYFNAVAVHPDGKIVAVGGTSQNSGEAAILRFNPNGTLDGSFANGGLLYINYPNLTGENFQSVALLPNAPPVGRIIVGGQGNASVPHAFTQNFLSSLYYSNGSNCQDFGTQCVVYFSAGSVAPALDLSVLPDGKILTVSDGTRRFLSNGMIDTSFEGGSFGSKIAVRSDGKFVIGGSFFTNYDTKLFANNGRFIGRVRNLNAGDIAVQADDKIISVSSTETEFVITRLTLITSQATRIADYDDDEKTNAIVLRQSDSSLYILHSSNTEFSVYRSGEASFEIRRVIPERYSGLPFWFTYWKGGNIIGSQASFCSAQNGAVNRICFQWGVIGDIPVGGDYGGDSLTDFAVFRPSEGIWYIYQNSNDQFRAVQWGVNGDKPVPADYDYDGITDIAIYRPSTGTWWIRRSSDGGSLAVQFGISSDIPLTGDFDADGKADFTVYRPGEGNWYQLLTTGGFRVVRFGLSTDIPVPGDYDGDGRHDVAVFRNGLWYLLQSTEGFKVIQWGQSDDMPVAVRYDR